jgi:hypothetical protein
MAAKLQSSQPSDSTQSLSPYTSFFKVLRLLIISSVTILTLLTFIQMVSLLAFHSHPHIFGPDARYEKYKLYFLAFTCKYAKKKVIKEHRLSGVLPRGQLCDGHQ